MIFVLMCTKVFAEFSLKNELPCNVKVEFVYARNDVLWQEAMTLTPQQEVWISLTRRNRLLRKFLLQKIQVYDTQATTFGMKKTKNIQIEQEGSFFRDKKQYVIDISMKDNNGVFIAAKKLEAS